MKNSIKRRDFLNGAAISVAAGMTLGLPDVLAGTGSTVGEGVKTKGPLGGEHYPPTLTGIRGSHDGAFDVAHNLAWNGKGPIDYEALDEEYDLVVVGAGISGLAAAFFYRQKMGDEKKILIIDNHDDFGGHARRNEFHHEGRMFLNAGGSFNLETHKYSEIVNQLMADLGVDFEKLEDARDPGFMFADLDDGQICYYLNAQSFGKDRIVQGRWIEVMHGGGEYVDAIESLELPIEQQERLLALIQGKTDLLNGMSLAEREEYIRSTSYREFAQSLAGLSDETIALLEPIPQLFAGLSLESYSVREALSFGAPGFKSLGDEALASIVYPSYSGKPSLTPVFPDGNASIARLLVRKLIPKVAPGDTMEDVVDAHFDYGKLDQPDAPVRLRLSSTVVNVVNRSSGGSEWVDVTYASSDAADTNLAHTVKAKHCVLACYNGIIPHLCPDMTEEQKAALKYGVKPPFVVTVVALRNGKAIREAGPVQHFCPDSFFNVVIKAPPVNLGAYQGSSEGDDPLLLSLYYVPSPRNDGTQSGRDLMRLGHHRLYTTAFSEYETEVRKQLSAMFGAQGFDADRDIAAITVNRWSHGYAYVYMDLYDPVWEEGAAPHEVGRKPMGGISIANSDSEAVPYLQGAVDAAWRAVSEQTS